MCVSHACMLFLLCITISTILADQEVKTFVNPCDDGWVHADFLDMGCLMSNTTEYISGRMLLCTARIVGMLTLDLQEPHHGVRPWWVGGTDIGREGSWYYSGTLQPVPEDPWYKPDNRPSCGLACNCMCILPNYQYYAADQPCTTNKFYPICQKYT